MEISNKEVCGKLFTRAGYYLRWYHDVPLFLTAQRRAEISRLAGLIYKSAVFMAEHYREYVDTYLPLSDKILEILDYQSAFAYKAGTYRPDFIVSEQNEIKVCEITSRFFAHGIFTDYYPECASDRYMKQHPGASRSSFFEEMLAYMKALCGEKDRIFVFKSADRTNEIELYQAFYAYFGKKVTVLEAEEVEERIDDWRGAFLISALNQNDLLSYRMETLRAMMDDGIVNDFRTVFLIHDKRFMRLWFEDAFTDRFLTKEETAFLRQHGIMTYVCSEPAAADVMRDAYSNKDAWILKHYCLGKSEKVFAGVLLNEKDWQKLWDNNGTKEMILQPFIRQKSFPAVWEGQSFRDYINVMMLCADDRYFGCGMVRSSSLPVTNVGDDRKFSVIDTDCREIIDESRLL